MSGLLYGEAAVLVLVHRGVSTVKDIAAILNTSVEEAKSIVESLEARGLIERVTTGVIFRREQLRLTRRGLEAIPEAVDVLKKASEALVKAAEDARKSEERQSREGLGEDMLALLPALLYLGLVPGWVAATLLPYTHTLAGHVEGGEEGESLETETLDADYGSSEDYSDEPL